MTWSKVVYTIKNIVQMCTAFPFHIVSDVLGLDAACASSEAHFEEVFPWKNLLVANEGGGATYLSFLVCILSTTNDAACLRADKGSGDTWHLRPLHVEDFEALVEGMLAMGYQLLMV